LNYYNNRFKQNRQVKTEAKAHRIQIEGIWVKVAAVSKTCAVTRTVSSFSTIWSFCFKTVLKCKTITDDQINEIKQAAFLILERTGCPVGDDNKTKD